MQELCQKHIDLLAGAAVDKDHLPCVTQETINRNTVETYLYGRKDGESFAQVSDVRKQTKNERLQYWERRLVDVGRRNTTSSLTAMVMTKFERNNILSHRAMQLASGAPPLCDVSSTASNLDIAIQELNANVLDCQLRRYLPDGTSDLVCVQALMKSLQH